MRDREFGIILMVVSVIIIGTILIFNHSETEGFPEGSREGFVQEVRFDEPMEITVPVTHYDFSDEEPMLITPDMAD